MNPMHVVGPADWDVAQLTADPDWIVRLDDRARTDLVAAVRKAFDADRPMLDYRRGDFDFGAAAAALDRAFGQAKNGRGIALVKGLPRADFAEKEFELLTWAIGLHQGVARPQGKATQYLSAVRDAGTVYRSAGGRGYSSNAELDFHTDGSDVVVLTCYNRAREGGMSMVSSSVRAHNEVRRQRPDLAEVLYQPFHFSRQQEQAPDEGPYYPNPVFDMLDGVFCSKWNRNRINSAQKIEGVPPLNAKQREAMDALDAALRRPDLMYTMWLEPGDMQILSNHTTLHSRTEFVDFDEPAQKRVLFRLWLAPPDGPRLPDSWKPFFRSVEARTVRGGILGHEYDAARREFEARQAADLGMRVAS
jgi:alpha-ketoglutarate-dependent taurine dioxygenase